MKKKAEKDIQKNKTTKASSKHTRLMGLFVTELQELLDAEHQIVKALPAYIKAADSPELKEAFDAHLEESKEQVARLEEIFTMLEANEKGEHCDAMQGLLQECNEAIEAFDKSALRDAAIISRAQRIEHYEMSIYGTLRSFAKELGLREAEDLLQLNQNEKINADKKFSKIAEGSLLSSGINRRANEDFQ